MSEYFGRERSRTYRAGSIPSGRTEQNINGVTRVSLRCARLTGYVR